VSDHPKPSKERNGNFLDQFWCCKVCGGEIPDGHLECCDIWKLEKKFNSFIAKEYNTALDERDALAARCEQAKIIFEGILISDDECDPDWNRQVRAWLAGAQGSAGGSDNAASARLV